MTGARLLVPVSDSDTLRNTVSYAVEEAREGAEADSSACIHFVYPVSERLTLETERDRVDDARELLERVTVWAEEDLGDDETVTVETALIGTRDYLFSPGDYADVLVQYARTHDLDLAVFDPGFDPIGTAPLLPTLEAEVARKGLEVREAPVQRPRRGPLLVRRATVSQFVALFGISFAFYLVLAGSLATFELVTGAISAGIVAVALWGVSLTTPISPGSGAARFARFLLYVPYLLLEIVRANLKVAYVVLHPDLPIDPEMVEFDAAVWSPLPVATLANSITLTPGTLTVDVSRRHFTVHTLTADSRDGLFDGALERAVRFVFYGRAAARIASPAERNATSDSDEAAAGASDSDGSGTVDASDDPNDTEEGT